MSKTNSKPKRRARASKVDELIRLANPKEYDRLINEGAERVKRYMRAAKGELPFEETVAAWREFGQLFARVASRGRLWNDDAMPYLALALETIDAETQMIDRTFVAVESCNDDPKLLRRIRSGFKHMPPLELVDALILALETPDGDTGRRLAGYLDTEAQPPDAEKLAEVKRRIAQVRKG